KSCRRILAMSSVRIIRICLLIGFFGVASCLLSSAQADLIIFKDGLVLHGKVQREGINVLDKPEEGPPVFEFIPKGFYYLDDGARRTVFNPQFVDHVERRKIDTAYNVEWNTHMRYLANRPTPPILEMVDVAPW